ncbi:4'-phosphopantetheinyl transferase family protein [Mucilaginibacter litoreus]|uniref:4'-phosphopantetheinyl transferase family protein n=1 Tax=Mucilaginibacter litoreus TaxID=1048221 RepID=A0ABW3AQ67_9SPHI
MPLVNWQLYRQAQGYDIPAPGEVHVWRINIRQNIGNLDNFARLLNAEENIRAARYLQQKDKHRFIISRGAQRVLLGGYVNVEPYMLQFIPGENKKPYLAGNNYGLHYNLSHSGEWIILAVAVSPVGADVEYIDKEFDYHDILPLHFSDEEVAYINQSNSTESFFNLWTRKEAILKATGNGLGEYLNAIPALDGRYPLPAQIASINNNYKLESFALADDYAATVVIGCENCYIKFFEACFI